MALAQDEFRSGSITAQNGVLELAQPATATVMVQLTGTWTGTVIFEVNVEQGDSPTWVAINAQNVNTGAQAAVVAAIAAFRGRARLFARDGGCSHGRLGARLYGLRLLGH